MPIPTPNIPEHFDYPKAARDARISDADLAALVRLFERDYPDDLMLRELHVLRACHAIREGRATVQGMLRESGGLAA